MKDRIEREEQQAKNREYVSIKNILSFINTRFVFKLRLFIKERIGQSVIMAVEQYKRYILDPGVENNMSLEQFRADILKIVDLD